MIKEFFYFPKSDRRVMIFLLVVIVLSVILIGVMDNGNMSTQLAQTDSLSADTSIYVKSPRRQRHYVYNVETAPRELFVFDPTPSAWTATVAGAEHIQVSRQGRSLSQTVGFRAALWLDREAV